MATYTDNKVRISIDLALFIAIIFNAGISWNAIHELKGTVEVMQREAQIQADARSLGYQRLARVEAKLDGISNQLEHMERQIDEINTQGSLKSRQLRREADAR